MTAPRRPVTGRRRLREEIQATWVVYEPAGRPGPFSQQGMAEAEEGSLLAEWERETREVADRLGAELSRLRYEAAK